MHGGINSSAINKKEITYVLDNEIGLSSDQFHVEHSVLSVNSVKFVNDCSDPRVFLSTTQQSAG